MDPVKLAGIQDWPVPTTVRETRKFLGFGNFYRRFIRGYSQLGNPMNDLLKKDHQFFWTDACQQAFDTLKKNSLKNQSSPCPTTQNLSRLRQTPPNMPLVQSSRNLMEMVTDIPSHLPPRHFPLPNEITTSTTKNSLQLSENWTNGDTTSMDHLAQQLSFCYHKNLTYYWEAKNSHNDKPNGPYIYWNSTSNWCILQEQKRYYLMPCLDDLTSVPMNTTIMKTL